MSLGLLKPPDFICFAPTQMSRLLPSAFTGCVNTLAIYSDVPAGGRDHSVAPGNGSPPAQLLAACGRSSQLILQTCFSRYKSVHLRHSVRLFTMIYLGHAHVSPVSLLSADPCWPMSAVVLVFFDVFVNHQLNLITATLTQLLTSTLGATC